MTRWLIICNKNKSWLWRVTLILLWPTIQNTMWSSVHKGKNKTGSYIVFGQEGLESVDRVVQNQQRTVEKRRTSITSRDTVILIETITVCTSPHPSSSLKTSALSSAFEVVHFKLQIKFKWKTRLADFKKLFNLKKKKKGWLSSF